MTLPARIHPRQHQLSRISPLRAALQLMLWLAVLPWTSTLEDEPTPAPAQPPGNPPFEYMVTKIEVVDLERSLAFYRDFFGYQEVLRTPVSPAGMVQVYTTRGGHNFRDGLTLVAQRDRAGPIVPGALNTLVFSVTNLRQVLARIAAAGYTITKQPIETRNYPSPVTSSVVIAYVQDPNGYRIEIVEWKPR